jgi:hypothetical protein
MVLYIMERQLSVGTINRKLDHLNQTRELLESENLDVEDIERQIRKLEKMKSNKSKKQPKKLSMETINRRLTEKMATVKMLRQMGADPAVVEKEMAELNKQKSMIESSGMASGKFPIKLLCFDLDETILTSTDPSVRAGNLSGLTYVGKSNIAAPGSPADMVDVVVNSKVIRLLEQCTKRDNIKWFIVSRGNNTEKLDVFMQYCASKGKRVMPDNEQYGINPFKNKDKKATVQKIIDKSGSDFEIKGVLFADDDGNNVRSVVSLGGITPINIPGNTWQADWLPITLLTDANIRECMGFIGVPMGALKKRKKTRRKSDKSKKNKSKSESNKSKKDKKVKKKKVFRGKKSHTSRK